MLIGIDGNEANIKSRVGVNVYAFELLRYIYQAEKDIRNYGSGISGGNKYRIYLQHPPRKDMPKENDFWEYRVIPGTGLWILTKLMPALLFEKEKPDVFFSPSHYSPLLSPQSRVASIMDLGYLEFSGQFRFFDYWQLKLWSAYSIFASKRVIAISQTTKRDIVRHYPFARDKVEVTLLGYSANSTGKDVLSKRQKRVRGKYSLPKNYILFLSTLKPSKNIEGLLRAFSLVVEDKKGESFVEETKLVVAGKKGWKYENIFSLVKALNLQDWVIFIDFVAEKDKAPLIAGAGVFVLPSFWEGFGLDVLTAQAFGTPVVVSNSGSLPEVAGEGGIYIDPYKAESIAGGIKKVLSMDKNDYNNLIEKGRENLKRFSWVETAKKTIEVLQQVGTKTK